MSIAAALKWLQADEKKTSSKHQDNYRHAALALLCGLLGSVGLGYAAVAYNVVANDSLASGEYAFIGYVLALYHVVMVFCRTLVKGPEELYNQMWACNAGMALATVGIFSGRRVLVGAAGGRFHRPVFMVYRLHVEIDHGQIPRRRSEISGTARHAVRPKSNFVASFMVLASLHYISA